MRQFLESGGAPPSWPSLSFVEHRALLAAKGPPKAGLLPPLVPMPARFDQGYVPHAEEQPSTSGRHSSGSLPPPICPIRPRAYLPRLSGTGKEESILSGLTNSSSSQLVGTLEQHLGANGSAQSVLAGLAGKGSTPSPSGLTGESRAAELGAHVNTDLMLGRTAANHTSGGGGRTGAIESRAGGRQEGSGICNRKRGASDEAVGSGNWKRLAQLKLPPSSSSSKGEEGSCNPCPPHGMLSVLGRRRTMEDAMAIVPSFMLVPWDKAPPLPHSPKGRCEPRKAALHFFGVYDGHGGPQAAKVCSERLHECLAEEMHASLAGKEGEEKKPLSAEGGQECLRLESALRTSLGRAFDHIDSELGGKCPQPGPCSLGGARCQHEPIAPEAVGTTAVVALVTPKQIVVANCGDSRAVLSRGGVAVPLSSDHKPDREDETKRVEAAGGRVIYYNGYRVLGVLAMSRAIGDRCLKPFVIAEPEVTCTLREAADECIVIASDGLWDVMNNEEVCHIARRCITGNLSKPPVTSQPGSPLAGQDPPSAMAAALLTKIALSRGSSDNISVVVINLHAVAAQ